MASLNLRRLCSALMLFMLCAQHNYAVKAAEHHCNFSMTVGRSSSSRSSSKSTPRAGSDNSPACVFNGLDPQTQPYYFESLQCALEAVITASLNGTVCIELASTEHQLQYGKTLQFDNAYSSVDVIIYSAEGAHMSCNSSVDDKTSQGHPLAMQGVASVHVRGLSFSGCVKPLLFLTSGKVEIKNCTFTDFTESALRIYDTPVIKITSSKFINNSNSGTELITNSGDAGAINIGYNSTYSNSLYPSITIENTVFENNTANVADNTTCNATSNAALSSKYYPGRAGAIGFYLASYGTEIDIRISNCQFYGNSAHIAGGGVYAIQSGRNNANNSIYLLDCTFEDNSAMDGGAVIVAFDTEDSIDNPGKLEIQNCNFSRNCAKTGGAVKFLQLEAQGNENQLLIKDTWFNGNNASIGSCVFLYKRYYGLQVEDAKRVGKSLIRNCMFTENLSKRGVVFINLQLVQFSGTNHFLNNTGPSIRVIGTLISMQGTLRFWNNRNSHEGLSGTVYVASFGQILLVPPLSVEFINNAGIEGAAIVVKSPRISGGFVENIYNPVCFLQFDDITPPPVDWKSKDVNIIFEGNVATIGPVLYISSLDGCSWFNNSEPYFNLSILETWTFMDTSRKNYILKKNGTMEDDPERYIQTEIHSIHGSVGDSNLAFEECNETTNCCSDKYVDVHPGQRLSLSLTALDQFGHRTSGFLRIRTGSQLDGSGSIDLSPTVFMAGIDNENHSFHYVGSQTNGTIKVFLDASFSPVEVSACFYLNYAKCPPGYSVTDSNGTAAESNGTADDATCTCKRQEEILDCDANHKYVLLADGLWGAGPELSQTLLTYPCPPGYCNCTGSPTDSSTEGCVLYFDEPFRICHSDRTGELCGECTGDLGVGMLTMDCRRFTAKYNMYYWLLPLLVLSVTVILVLVIRTGFKVPSLLRGFIYYIQISGVAVSYAPQSIDLAAKYMVCVASALALYVPYDFVPHENLTALESVGLRYVSPALALAVVPVAMRIKHNPISWNGLWTLILLMYAMSISTSTSLTFCVSLELENGSHTVWFYDGSVECYKGAHLALMIVACVWLVLAALLVPFLAVVSYQSEINNKFKNILGRHFDKCSKVLVEPYKENCKWWTSYELLRRYFFIMCAILIPTNLTWPTSLVIFDLTVQWFVQPYKDRLSNVAESFCLGSLAITLCLAGGIQTLSAQSVNVILWPLLYLPLVIGVLCGVAIVAINLWRFLRKAKKVKAEDKLETTVPFSRSRTLHVKEKRERVTKTHVSFDEDDEL